MEPAILLLPLLAAVAGAVLAGPLAVRRPGRGATVGVAAGLAAAGAALAAWAAGVRSLEVPWAPAWGLRFALALDGLALLYVLLAGIVGAAVCLFARGYLPHHLEDAAHPGRDSARFYALLLLFMAAMIGLALAQDLLLLVVFWDLTALTSYFLIAFDRHLPEARRAALMALLVTGVSSIGFLVGALLLRAETGSLAVAALAAPRDPAATLVPAGLIAVAALAKSAQVPLHFWLPRAMVAPTPVSAYLHSAAMVAAGVFALARLHALFAPHASVRAGLVLAGLASMAVGGLQALVQLRLKQLLAYSTIAQYGYVLVLLGLGGESGAVGAGVYILAHAVAKSALFLTAGAVTQATGEDRLDRVGGLRRTAPWLAAASAVAAATLAGLPLTLGFFKDELFFRTVLEHGRLLSALAVAGAAMTLAYAWRFWAGCFLGRPAARPGPVPGTLVAPIAGLAALALGGGLAPAAAAALARPVGAAIAGRPTPLELAYHLDARAENLLALLVYALGAALVLSRRRWAGWATALVETAGRAGPERVYHLALDGLNRFSRSILVFELRDLRGRIAAVLFPSAVLIGVALVADGTWRRFAAGPLRLADAPLALALALTMVAAVGTARPRGHVAILLGVSSVGFTLAAVYALYGAPDLAVVAVLVETLLSILFLGMLTLFPRPRLERQAARRTRRRRRDVLLGVTAGAGALVVAGGALSGEDADAVAARAYLDLAAAAHGGDVVTVILADFRGLDTVGEITVVGVALVGILSLLGRRRRGDP